MDRRKLYREMTTKLADSYVNSFSPSPRVARSTKYWTPGDLKGSPDVSVEGEGELTSVKLAIEVICEPVSVDWLTSRLTRLKQTGYDSVAWYLLGDINNPWLESWLWKRKQEGYIFQGDSSGNLIGWRDISCPYVNKWGKPS